MDIRMLVASKAKEPVVINVEKLGDVAFYPISVIEMKMAEESFPDAEERGYFLLWKMLAPGSEGLTLEEVRSWPMHIVTTLTESAFSAMGFRVQ